MRSHLEFRSAVYADDGAAIAQVLAEHLPHYGFQAQPIVQEDWGWCVPIAHEAFSLWIGCGHYLEYPDGVLWFIEPSRPFVRRWFRRISTMEPVERLADALEAIVEASGEAKHIRWWTDEEVAAG
ncbi:hypothetical protein [Sphingobium yanoikuyae]|uniref:hypothetical protein n=1 Tax=Sphingobium yanoikuyae TaxID=13690 RepID=UPI0035C6B41F